DLNRRVRALDGEDGKVLWESVVGGMVMMSTITYSVNGKQYVMVFTGEGQSVTGNVLALTKDVMPAPVHGASGIYVFALPYQCVHWAALKRLEAGRCRGGIERVRDNGAAIVRCRHTADDEAGAILRRQYWRCRVARFPRRCGDAAVSGWLLRDRCSGPVSRSDRHDHCRAKPRADGDRAE